MYVCIRLFVTCIIGYFQNKYIIYRAMYENMRVLVEHL